jgi:hypothetical protein
MKGVARAEDVREVARRRAVNCIVNMGTPRLQSRFKMEIVDLMRQLGRKERSF